MAIPRPNPSIPRSNNEPSIFLRRGVWRCIIVCCAVAVLYISQQEKRLDIYIYEDEHHMLIGSPSQRCVDADDDARNLTVQASTDSKCLCFDPLRPAPRRTAVWAEHHQQLEATALTAALEGVEVVFLGDSIVEHFGGTRKMGQIELPDEARLFEAFSRDIPSVALGCSGDTSPNLFYHLQHGILHPRLTPRIWVVVIGTNDLSLGCSKRTTLAGILQVAQVLHQQRLGTKIVVHGLFPRADEAGQLDQHWDKIVWINQQLKKFCALHDEWLYFDINNRILRRELRSDGSSQIKVKVDLLPDGLHPSLEGYKLWAKELKVLMARELSDGDDEAR